MKSRWWGPLVFVFAACHSFRGDEASTPATNPPLPDGGGATNQDGAAGTPPDGAAAPCQDLQSDPRNCGGCGHSCLGGACHEGKCQGVVLQTFTGMSAVGLAVSATQIAWLVRTPTGGILSFCATSDSCTHVSYSTNPATALGMAVVGDAIFASFGGGENTRVMKIDNAGKSEALSTGDGQFLYPVALAGLGDASGVYVLDDSDAERNGVYQLLDDKTITRLAHIASNNGSRQRILAAADRVFTFEDNGIFWMKKEGIIDQEMPPWCPTGCLFGMKDFTSDGKTLYWATASRTIEHCAIDDTCTGSTQTASSLSFPEAPLWVEATGTEATGIDLVITTDVGDDSSPPAKIYRCGINTCAQKLAPIITEPAFATKPFTTPTAVYWIADDGPADGSLDHSFRLMRLAQ